MSSTAFKRFPEELIGQKVFFKRYNVEASDFARSGLDWSVLKQIYADYNSWWHYLHPAAAYIANVMALEPGVHAISHRVKDPEHLVEKIIRYSRDKGAPWATRGNYRRVVKDLIGVRGLHLFKEEWSTVHSSILRNWEPLAVPVANVRPSDPEHVKAEFRRCGCRIVERSTGYSSVHYEIGVRVARARIAVELQVRTLFEEAWGEVSHRVQYPYFRNASPVKDYTVWLSLISGLGDSLASAAMVVREGEKATEAGAAADVLDEIKRRARQRLKHVGRQILILGEHLAPHGARVGGRASARPRRGRL